MNQYSYYKQSSGYSLIELMITITLGSFLILGAAYAFQEASKTYRTNDNVAKLYEQAQYAMSALEEDIRLTNYWGDHARRTSVSGDIPDGILSIAPVAPGLENISGDCSNAGWALDLSQEVEGSNENTPAWAPLSCASDFQENTDTFSLRRSDTVPVFETALENGQVYIRSNSTVSQIFLGNNGQPDLGADALNFEYFAHGYFVAKNSSNGNDKIPTLMRETLVDNGNLPAVETQEIIRGVEDLQIQYGIDYGKSSLGNPEYGMIDQYVNPDSLAINSLETRVTSMRFWLLLRAEQPEYGYTDTNTYNYANINDYQPNDNFRRLLVSKTVKFRNIDSND